MQNLLDELKDLLASQSRFMQEGRMIKQAVIDAAQALDTELLQLLLSHEAIKRHFFQDVGGILVFDKVKLLRFVSNKAFLEDSYTAFKNKIGLINKNSDGLYDAYLSDSKEVVLAYPYKDCLLEGGQTKEDAKRNEIFWNEILAPDDIDRLKAPKAFSNVKRYDSEGVHENITDLSLNDNYIIKGNNLLALYSLLPIYRGKVKLIYIDPPYNTGNDSFRYNDSFNHSTWLTFMKDRLKVARELLSNNGFIFVQINDDEASYLKILLDEIFGRENFQTVICVKMSHLSGTKMAHKDKKLPKIKEHIIMFAKNSNLVSINPVYIPVEWEVAFERYTSFLLKNGFEDNNCDKWERITLSDAITKYKIDVKNEKEVEKFKIENAHLIFRTSINRGAEYSNLPKNTFIKIEKSHNDYHFVYNGEDVNFASDKVRVFNGKQKPSSIVGDIWLDIGINNLSNEGGVSLRFGKKPEKLIARIIELTTKEGDIVLDFFAGSGTTAAVAHKMLRKYITVEQIDYVNELPIPRIQSIISNLDNTGISKETNWQGGGSFVYMELAKANQYFVEQIEAAHTDIELTSIWDKMKAEAFISYRIDLDKESEYFGKEYEALSFEDKKRFLIETLDKNMLYVPYCDIESKEFGMNETDKAASKAFYNLNHNGI